MNAALKVNLWATISFIPRDNTFKARILSGWIQACGAVGFRFGSLAQRMTGTRTDQWWIASGMQGWANGAERTHVAGTLVAAICPSYIAVNAVTVRGLGGKEGIFLCKRVNDKYLIEANDTKRRVICLMQNYPENDCNIGKKNQPIIKSKKEKSMSVKSATSLHLEQRG